MSTSKKPGLSEDISVELKINSRNLKRFINSCNGLARECRINLGAEQMELVAKDDANIVSIYSSIGIGGFKDYDIDREYSFGIETEKITKLLRMADRKHDICILSRNRCTDLEVSFGNTRFVLSTIDPGTMDIQHNSVEGYTGKYRVESSIFHKTIEAAKVLSEKISLKAGPGEILATAENNDGEDIKNELSPPELVIEDYNKQRSVESKFSSEYIESLVSNCNGDIELELNENYPLICRSRYSHGEGYIEYCLAPRLD